MHIVSILVGLILGYGAAEQLVVRGIRDGLLQPAIIGALATIASVLLIVSGIVKQRRLTIIAAIAIIAVHAYGVLPPHHNVGAFAAILGVGYGVLLLVMTLRRKGSA